MEMNSWALKFLNVSITSVIVGAGLGVLTAWCMTVQLERQYQMAITEAGSALGAIAGLVLGWIAYYGIFKQEIKYETFCAVVAVTAVATAVTAYVLHKLTDTGGWFSIFLGIAVFLAASLRLKYAG